MNERSSLLASAAAVLAFLAVLGVALGVALAHLGVVAPMTGFQLFLLAALDALLAMVVGGLGLLATRARPGRPRALAGLGVGALVVGLVLVGALPGRGLPRINDITTSPDDPPAFVQAGQLTPNQGRDMGYPDGFAAQQRAAYPDLAPIRVAAPPAEAFERAREAALALGWQVQRSDAAAGLLEAADTSSLFQFVDDVVVRVRPADGGSVVDVRSKSRDGQGDLGINARRIRAFAEELR
ncbi:MAG: DUF1499 domain-containing protein [Myxococcota bacterium]|nr:DUF1499 domain-containing protein [Myxococcota bacterium]